MTRYSAPPTPADRAKALAGVVAIHAGLATLILVGARIAPERIEQAPTELIDVALEPPPPPPPPPQSSANRPERDEGAAGKKAEPSPVVAPPPRLPAPTPLPAAPVAGVGSATTAGAAASGTGTGAGGAGSGRGGGGSGEEIGENARLLSGGLNRRDYRRLRSDSAPSGRAVLGLLVGPDGRVAQCSVRQTSGDGALDANLCAILQPRMLWSPARDLGGRAVTVGILYTAVWSRN